ncbi:hypothetical protein ACFL58_01945 [Elusimicrobiota bacterium]
MKENVRLLMEETDCEQGEAELALELADNDLQKAIRTIGSLLKQIFAIKGKIYFASKNLYGLFLIILNVKTKSIIRLHSVVSYNPSLYENPTDTEWYALEKLIFYYRLDEGSLPDFTQDLEHRFRKYINEHREIYKHCSAQTIDTMFRNFFSEEKIVLDIRLEELNLEEFRQLPDNTKSPSSKITVNEKDPTLVWLEVGIIEDENGKDVNHLAEGDIVLSQILDTRDIAHYLAHLIGGRLESKMIPLPAAVRKVSANDDDFEIQVFYASGIVGRAKVKKGVSVKTLESKNQPWWKKMLPWN